MFVRDIMSRPPITAKDTDTVAGIAKIMSSHDIGCVIIVDKLGKPEGIITERDIVERVAAKNLRPSEVKVIEAMSKPIIGIPPTTPLNDAAKRMNQSKIRRLAVIDGGKLVGILTMKDILEVTPALLDLVSERSRVEGLGRPKPGAGLAGYCDECEVWSESLLQKDGVFLCPDCAKDIGGPEES